MATSNFARSYHERTKHHYQRMARSRGYMDWANQPDPFRRFEGAPITPLPLTAARQHVAYDELYSAGNIESQALNIDTLGSFFELSLGLSAWKEFQGSRWALRVNPSSGNLHPTEGYALCDHISGLTTAGVYHYAPKIHALELRLQMTGDMVKALTGGDGEDMFLVGLSSILWREEWKYGERSYRYCQHDIGHAIAALALAAAVHGWSAGVVHELSDADLAAMLGLDRDSDYAQAEREEPAIVMAVSTQHDHPIPIPRADVIQKMSAGTWSGRANVLSTNHNHWEVVDAVAQSCRKAQTQALQYTAAQSECPAPPRRHVSAAQIIAQRRSAVAMDGATDITARQFGVMLERTMPRAGTAPFDTLAAPVMVHLGLFVHRVKDLAPGCYVLVRCPEQLEQLRQAMDPSFEWSGVEGPLTRLPLFRLHAGDYRVTAARISCGQAIAGDGAFSLGMISTFEEPLQRHGEWLYRRLFWECGAVGQVLYLEAEAAGVRGTGIGCFFDDAVHDVFGLSGSLYQSLYHFTIGGAIDDDRLSTRPPYDHVVQAGER